VPVSRTTVARFCRDVLHPSHPRKQRSPASRNSRSQPQDSFAVPANTSGPRIAAPNTI
jgi:hypothetical protein